MYTVNKNEAAAKLTVEIISDEEKYVVNVTFTSPSIREAILSAAEGGKLIKLIYLWEFTILILLA